MFEVYHPKRGRKKRPTWQQKNALPTNNLVALAHLGDTQAMEILIDRFKCFAWKVAFQMKIHLPGSDRDDLKQESMIGLYDAIMDYDREKCPNFTSFIAIRIRSHLIGALVYLNRKKHQVLNMAASLYSSDEDDKAFIDVLPGRSPDPLKMVIAKENEEELHKLVIEKFTRLENIVLAYRVRGFSYQEIAQAVDIDIKSVDNAVSRIKKKAESFLMQNAS